MEKVLQIGEGNFLRAFIEEYIQDYNEKNNDDISVVICQPRTNNRVINSLNEQGCQYDIILRGRLDGSIVDERKHINCVSRAIDTVNMTDKLIDFFCSEDLSLVISNTTEAGICFNEADEQQNFPSVSFPAKLTYLLSRRFEQGRAPLIFLPVELISNNGAELKKCILSYAELWELSDEFVKYIEACTFCSTLVDRIVTGHNDDDEDACSVCCEPYKSFIIQADEATARALPFDDSTIVYTDDITPFRERKVRILNGAHTMSVLGAYLDGFDIVRDMVNDGAYSGYISEGLEEIKSTIPLDKDELDCFACSVLDRFNNPFIDHRLLDIALNSVAKYNARVLPSIVDYEKANGTAPAVLPKSLAYLIAFYNHKSEREYEIRDDEAVMEFFSSPKSIREVMSSTQLWDTDLMQINGFYELVDGYYNELFGE